VWAAAALTLAVAGCTGGVPTGSVSGKVTYEGKTVRRGSVMFVTGNSKPVYAQINDEGMYEAQGVPAGKAKVTVTSPDPKGGGRREREVKDAPRAPVRGEKGPEVKGWFPIPDQYSDPARSGLSFDVKAGPNTYDIELKKPPPS
jgi:hypothetical protein